MTILEQQLIYADAAETNTFLHPCKPIVDSDVLEALPAFHEAELNWHTIRRLGKETQDQQTHSAYRQAAEMLSAGSEPFSLSCEGNGGGYVSFKMGIHGDEDGRKTNSLLGAAFGIADTVKSDAPKSSSVVWQAKCKPIKLDITALDRMEKQISPAKWADAVAAAIIGTDCTVCVSFRPAESKWVADSLKAARDAEKNIAQYLKRHTQLSTNYGENSSNGNNSNKLLSIHHVAENDSSGTSASLALSQDFSTLDIEAESLDNILRYRIRLLEQISCGGWFVRITISNSSDDEKETSIVCTALGAALLSIGYSCEWIKQPNAFGVDSASSVVLPAYLLPALISFPMRPFVGFSPEPRTELNLNPPRRTDGISDDLPIGTILWNGVCTTETLCVPHTEINRHMFVCGMTGSGKTNTVCSLLESLSDLHYLVIEPVKGEYHSLPGVRRYTMNAGESIRLCMNPFWFPEGSSLQYHVDSLKLIISSAFDLYAAMPNILEQCLYRAYMNCGWDLISGRNIYSGELPDEDLYPTFRSLCGEIERYLDESAFEGETAGNYRGALLSRLQSFTSGAKGALLNTTEHISFDDWAKRNVVVELDALADDADKAIVMGTLLIQYFQFIKYKSEHKAADGLRHLFVLEEAHHLFREMSIKNGESQSASSHLVNMLNHLLAEIRAYGEGFIIIDQSPSGISPSVLKNTGVKIVHRVDYGEDIKLLQSVLLLKDGDCMTAALERGEALIRFGAMHSPAHVRIPLCNRKEEGTILKDMPRLPVYGSAQDRILSNEALVKTLKCETERFLNTVLFGNDSVELQNAFEIFRESAYRMITNKCGWDSVVGLSAGEYYIPLLDVCVVYATEEAYPGQYCMNRMIRMFILRMAKLVAEDEFGNLSEKEWSVLSDYREKRIYPRLSFFYKNEPDPVVQHIVAILGDLPYVGIIRRLADAVWNVKEERDDAFCAAMDEIFYIPLSDIETEYMKSLTEYYIHKGEEL